jgi:hypothetical protein
MFISYQFIYVLLEIFQYLKYPDIFFVTIMKFLSIYYILSEFIVIILNFLDICSVSILIIISFSSISFEDHL